MSFLFGKKVNTVTAAEKISQFQSTTCDFGTPLPYVFGTAKRGPNLINYQDFYAKPIVSRQKTGKRSHATQIDYQYYAYIELALCEGIIDGINRLWVGDKEYASLAAFNASGDNQGAPLSLNTGSVTSPTAYMASHHPDIAVGYDQMAYLYGYVFLGLNNASIPSYSFEVQGLLRGSGDGTDANPAAVIAFLLTLLGYGGNIDSTSYTEYLLYCEEADLLISTPADAFTSQKKCQEVIKELLALTNTYMFWSVDRFKFVPRDTMQRGQWTPRAIGSGPHLTPDDMAKQTDGACVIYERKDSSEVYNRFGVVFTSRDNQYEAETVFYEDTNDIAVNGIKSAPDVDGKWLHKVERAVTVAEMQARINRTENIRYTFQLSWSFAYLEPGDLVTLTDPVVGLNQQLVMIDSITENADETLTVTALRREDTTAVTYNTGTDDYNIINNNGDPGSVRTPVIFTPPSALASSSYLEVWIALQGQNTSWGGCQVYASTKDGDYELSGTHNRTSNYGKLLTALTDDGTTVDVEFSNVDTVELLAGSAQDAADGLTDIYIDGEFCAYTAATLIGTNQYRLTLVRGKYGSTAAAHTIDSSFALMDGNLFSLQLPKNLVDKTLYLKFPSFNTLGSVSQDVTEVGYYTYSSADEGYTDAYVAEQLVPYAKTSDLSAYATINDLNGYVAKTSADYLKSASVSGNTLTLTKGDDNTVTFTPSGGSGGGDVTTNTDQNITGVKTFVGQKRILFKQSANTDKLGFTLYTNGDVEKGYFEFNPSNTVDNVPLMTIGNYATASAGLTHVGFRKYSGISGASGAYNLLAPLVSDARTPFNLTTTYTNFYLPLGVTDGTTTVKTAKSGLLDISSLLPSLPIASANTLGGIKVGNNLSIDANGVLSASGGGGGGGSYTAGDGIDISNDVISLETASANGIGGVKVGSGLSIDANGVLSATGGGGNIYTREGMVEDILFSDSSGVNSGTINLSGNISDYDLISIQVGKSNADNNACIFLSSYVQAQASSSKTVQTRFSDSYINWYYGSDSSIVVPTANNGCKIYKIVGIKFGRYISGVAVDTTVTQGSSNVVTSGAVYNAIQQGGLSPSDITTGTTNGTISVDGTDVAVAGLDSSAYLSDSYFYKLRGYTKIPANSDLNSYTNVGSYVCDSNADASSLSNCPITNGFKMIVEQTTSSSYIVQTIISRPGSQWKRYTSNGGTTWNSWSAYGSTDDYLPLSGGTVTGNLTVSGTLTASLTGNADTASQLVSTEIPANADLNDYTTVGDYYSASNANASSLSNCPATVSFHMEVRTSGARYQQIIFAQTNIFIRNRTSSTWQSWYKFTGSVVS